MFSQISKYFLKPLVPIIRLKGDIDIRSAILVSRSLKKISPGRSKAIGLVIDSDGGSPAQSEIILQRIKAFCQEHKLPLYTFTENKALAVGYWILCAGDKVYADRASAIGSIGANISHVGVDDFLESKNVHVRTWTSDPKKVIPSLYYDVQNMHLQDMQRWTDNVREKFIEHVEKQRGPKLHVAGNERDEKLYQGRAWSGEDGLQFGLVDSLGTYASVFFKEFPKARVVDVSEMPTIYKYQETTSELIKLFSSRALPWIIAYFCIKGTIKLYLLLLVVARKKKPEKEVEEELKELDTTIEKLEKEKKGA